MLKSNFLKPELNIDFFGKTRFWGGIGLGIGSSVFLYCFLFLMREIIRVSFSSLYGEFPIINSSHLFFYNYFLAFASLLFGQYVFFEFTLFRNRQAFQKRDFLKRRIVTDSRFVSWNSLFIGFDLFTFLGMLTAILSFGIWDFYSQGWWICVFLMVWIHFFNWLRISRKFKYGYRWGLKSFFGITLFAILLAQIQPTNPIKNQNNLLANVPSYKYKIHVPTGTETTKLVQRSLVKTFYLAPSLERQDSIIYASSDGYEFQLDSLPLVLEDFKNKIHPKNHKRIVSSLVIEKSLKMKTIYKFLNRLKRTGNLKISYAFLDPYRPNKNIYAQYYSNGFRSKLAPGGCDQLKYIVQHLKENPNTGVEFLEKISDKNFLCGGIEFLADSIQTGFKIRMDENGEIFSNEELTSRGIFLKKIKTEILTKKSEVFFHFEVATDATFEDYFWALNEIKKAHNEVQNEISQTRHNKDLEFLPIDLQAEIRRDYPMVIFELMTEEERFIFNFFQK